MPIFADEFGVSAATSSLAVSATTATLAISMIFAGTLSETIGRKPLMVASVFSSATLLLLSAFGRDWHRLVVLRALTGIALSGLPSVAMAYVSEEIETRSVGLVMGLYIGGSGLGGMTARFAAGVIADHGSWRLALEVVGGLGLVAALIFSQALAPSRNFTRRRMAPADIFGAFGRHLADPALRALVREMLQSGAVPANDGALPATAADDRDSLRWLDLALSALWPYLAAALETTLLAALEPVLESSRPAVLSQLRLERCWL
eukprot:gene37277-44666_t